MKIPFQPLLEYNVPRFIEHIKKRGGVTDAELLWLQCEDEDVTYPLEMITRADEYLLYPRSQEIFDKSLFTLVKALAIMSFIPGGVRFLNLHFCSEIENFYANNGSKES
jgi:hypothetical protein